MHLHGNREQPVIARTRRGRDTIGDFPLHHQHRPIQYRRIFRQLEQNGRCDVIRQIAGDDEPLACRSGSGRKIERQHIDGFNLYIGSSGNGLSRAGAKLCRQAGGKLWIHFERQHLSSFRSEFPRDRAHSRADLDDGASGAIT